MTKRKSMLFELCRSSIRQKIAHIQELIQEAQQSANEETKSSAGDKYETGRAMVQLEIEKYAAQLNELNKQGSELEKISSAAPHDKIGPAAVVETSNGNFFIAVNAGEFVVDGIKYFAVSTHAPIAQKMIGLSKDDSFSINGRAYRIISAE
ncbi:MAG: 3-oxoacyl-ACP synthase [Chryseolinea sp.]